MKNSSHKKWQMSHSNHKRTLIAGDRISALKRH